MLRLTLAGFVAGILATIGLALLLLVLVDSPAPGGGEATGQGGTPAAGSSSPPASGSSPASSGAPSSAAPDSVAPDRFGIGGDAPGLALPQLGGGRVDLAALRGHPVWVVFTATWCPSCLDDATVMTSFGARYQSTGLVVLAVDVREDEATVAAFAANAAAAYPIALDLDGSASRRWGVLALPTHFFVDASGVVRAGATGTVGRDELARSLAKILPGVDVTP